MQVFLKCLVGKGLFTGEYAVQGIAADGTGFSLFVADEYLDGELPTTDDCNVDGWIAIDIIERKGDLALVRLPGETFENGRFVTVNCQEIRKRCCREIA
jgi:hypothetical protein